MFLKIVICCLLIGTITYVKAEISEVSGLDWNDMPADLIPADYVDPTELAAEARRAVVEEDVDPSTLAEDNTPPPYTSPEVRDFLEAASFGNQEEMQQLLDEGLDVDSVEARGGDTALHSATWANKLDAVKFLIDNQADTNIKNAAGYTPLLLAVRREGAGSLDIMKTLLLHGRAKPWVTNNNGNTALHWAAHLGRMDVVKWLLGEDDLVIDMPNEDGLTPLMLAATSGKDNMVKLLLENKASYDMEGSFGRTPLEQAAHKGHARVVQLLLKNGAPWKDHKDKLGDNALDLARAQGHTQVEFLLEGRDPMTGEEISKDEEDVDSEPTDL